MFWIGIIVGIFAGSFFGAAVMSWMIIARRADDANNASHHEMLLR